MSPPEPAARWKKRMSLKKREREKRRKNGPSFTRSRFEAMPSPGSRQEGKGEKRGKIGWCPLTSKGSGQPFLSLSLWKREKPSYPKPKALSIENETI